MEKHVEKKTEEFKSESSVISHPIAQPKSEQTKFPTWALIGVLFVCFFVLKSFIYITDKKRQGK